MRKLLIWSVAATSLCIGAAACSGGGGGDDDDDGATSPTPTPTPAGTASTLTFTGTAWTHNGNDPFVRILDGGGTVVWCTQGAPIASNTWSVMATAGTIVTGTTYTYETWVDLGNGAALNPDGNYDADTEHEWTGTFTPTTASTTVTVPHSDTQAPITWTNNQPCPGT